MSKRAVLLGLLIGSASACGFDSAPTGHAVCVEGQSADCACDDGARGVHTCSQGELGACTCAPESGSSPTGPASDGAGASSTGESGSGGSGTVPATSGLAGAGTGPGGGAGSGSLAAGSGASSAGSGGAGDAGSSAGEAGSSAGEAGSSASDAGSGGHDAPLPPAKPGTPYGACAAQGECQAGMLCYTFDANDETTGYCAPPCTIGGTGSGGLVACPQPKSGEVQAQCAPFLSVCLLAACEGQDCPSGMECVETVFPLPQQSGLYNCRYPVSP